MGDPVVALRLGLSKVSVQVFMKSDAIEPSSQEKSGLAEKGLSTGALVVLAGLFAVGFALLPRILGSGGKGQQAGEVAPDFQAKLVLNAGAMPSSSATAANGPVLAEQFSLSELKGNAVVLDFWATWCGPCRAEAPIMNNLAKKYAGKNVVVIGVNTDDEAGNAEVFAKQKGLVFPIAFDANHAAARAYHVTGLPTLVVVGKTGKIVASRTGVTSERELEQLVQEALAE
jgi:cytochrome c biogenesis protein CcmG, thiol:disulfide interchange protein DsbE